MIEGGRQANCPNCGGPIEFKLGASAALVCPWCRFSVARSDRDLRAIGKVADLVPTAPVMTVGDQGRADGRPFTVGGRLQLDHGAGPWDEWWVAFGDGSWGWLAQGQGRWYLTQPTEASGLPTWEQMVPGNAGQLPGSELTWTVAERGQSTLVSAEGELPFPAVPGERGRYVDLQGPGGAFATLDYGDGSGTPIFYLGRELPADSISFRAGGGGPRPVEKVQVERLRCPSCGGPVPILRPGETERAACQSCGALLDFEAGALSLLKQLDKPRVEPWIPLGGEGTLRGEELLCIGFMERCTVVDGVTYAWREYLLHGDGGYRWLMEDSGNWTYIRPISAGDVGGDSRKAQFEGRSYKPFASNRVSVRFVLGEFYWKVEVGESSQATDLICPPHLLSEERTPTEVIWSAGEWIPPREIWDAFGLEGDPPKPTDVAPAQPNPVKLGYPLAVATVFLVLLALVALVARPSGPEVVLVDGPVTMPAAPDAAYQRQAVTAGTTRGLGATAPAKPTPKGGADAARPTFTEPFRVPDGTRNVAVTLRSDLGHGWVGVALALVNQTTGELYELVLEDDRYYETGSPTAPTRSTTEWLGPLPPGEYTMRVDPRWARQPGSAGATEPPTVGLRVETGAGPGDVFCPCCCAGFLLLLPALLALVRRSAFERRRWSLSNLH